MKNREYRALMAIALMTALVAGSVKGVSGTAYAKEGQTVSAEAITVSQAQTKNSEAASPLKDETVYAKVDGSGNVKSVTVSDQLKNIGNASEVTDASVLENIENVKGDEVFQASGDTLIWDADSKDICYQGTTRQTLPVGIQISYRLDGQDISAEELEGQSGHLTVRYDYKNTTPETSDDYVPFLMVTGLIMDSDKFTNVTITNGKLVSDGDRNMVIGMGLPQMKEHLGVDDLDIPDYFEVEADVTDYEAVEGITVATNSIFNELGTDKLDSLSDLEDSLNQLQDASSQLVSGSGELKNGLDTLLSSSGTLIEGVNALADGGNTLTGGTGALLSGSKALADGSSSLAYGTSQLLDGTGALKTGAKQVADGAASAAAQTNADSALATGVNTLNAGIGQLGTQLGDGFSTLENGVDAISSGITSVNDGAQSLLNAVNDNKAYVTGALDAVKSAAQNLSQTVPAVSGTSISAYDVAYGNGGTDSAVDTLNGLLAREDISDDAKAAVSGAIASLQADQSSRQASAGVLDAEINAQTASVRNAANVVSGINDVITAADNAETAFNSYVQGISDGTGSLIAGIGQLSDGASELKNGINASSQTVASGIAKLNAGSQTLTGGIGTLNNGLKALSSGASQVNSGSQTLNEKMAEADSGAKVVSAGAAQISSGTAALNAGALTLSGGINTLQSGSGALLDGIQKLDSGAAELNSGMIQFNDDGIQKLVSVFDGDINGLLEKLNTMLDTSKSYKNFSGISDGMDGKVKFIFVSDK